MNIEDQQAIVAQQHAITQLRARAGGGAAGYGQPSYTPQPGYAPQPGYGPGYQQQRQGGGFLAGAGKIALGVGGGILAADAAKDIFHGVENMFDGDRGQMYQDQQYDQGYQQGMEAGEQRDMGQFGGAPQYDNMQYDNMQQQFGQGGFDDGGGFL